MGDSVKVRGKGSNLEGKGVMVKHSFILSLIVTEWVMLSKSGI